MRLKLTFLILFVTCYGIIKAQNIFGGEATDISEVPWQVSVERDGGHWCGGSILNAEWILSAAHCYNGFGGNFMVHAGSTFQRDDNVGQRIVVDQIIIHPDYDGNHENGSDLALLHLAQPLCFNENAQPIEIADQNTQLEPGMIAIISGWGDDGDGCCTDQLLSGQLPLITDAEANDLNSDDSNRCPPALENAVGATTIAFFEEGIAAGPGDSGGPAVIDIDGVVTLVGASSWGGCPRDEFPTMYADVGALSEFVFDNIDLIHAESIV